MSLLSWVCKWDGRDHGVAVEDGFLCKVWLRFRCICKLRNNSRCKAPWGVMSSEMRHSETLPISGLDIEYTGLLTCWNVRMARQFNTGPRMRSFIVKLLKSDSCFDNKSQRCLTQVYHLYASRSRLNSFSESSLRILIHERPKSLRTFLKEVVQ
jgi:hypothetical protein